jgi:hypothetical protein
MNDDPFIDQLLTKLGTTAANGIVPAERVLEVSSWESIDLGPVLRGERVTVPPSILARNDNVFLLYPGRINVAFGESESLKSWFALEAAKRELDAGRHVLYIDFEDTPETAVERLRALGTQPEQIESHLTYLQPSGRYDDMAQAIVGDLLKGKGVPSLAVIDGVTEAMAQAGLNPDAGTDVVAFYASYPRQLARAGAASLLLDHMAKSRENRGSWAIGSERKKSGMDGASYQFDIITPFGRGKTGKVKISVSKDRCGYIREHEGAGKVISVMELRSWPDGGVTASLEVPEAGQSGALRPTFLMQKLSEAIIASPGLSTNALKTAVRGAREYKVLALELLVAEGFVSTEPGPNRSQLHFSRMPFLPGEAVGRE